MRWGESGTWFVDGREGTSASCSMIQMMATDTVWNCPVLPHGGGDPGNCRAFAEN